jgi:hypothetical protein
MILYEIKLYDAKTNAETFVVMLPERRADYDRPRGRRTIEKWIKSLIGEDWWFKNWHNITIRKRNYFERGDNRKAIQPPKRGGVD